MRFDRLFNRNRDIKPYDRAKARRPTFPYNEKPLFQKYVVYGEHWIDHPHKLYIGHPEISDSFLEYETKGRWTIAYFYKQETMEFQRVLYIEEAADVAMFRIYGLDAHL